MPDVRERNSRCAQFCPSLGLDSSSTTGAISNVGANSIGERLLAETHTSLWFISVFWVQTFCHESLLQVGPGNGQVGSLLTASLGGRQSRKGRVGVGIP